MLAARRRGRRRTAAVDSPATASPRDLDWLRRRETLTRPRRRPSSAARGAVAAAAAGGPVPARRARRDRVRAAAARLLVHRGRRRRRPRLGPGARATPTRARPSPTSPSRAAPARSTYPALRGVTVPGRRSRRCSTWPRRCRARSELAIQVVVSRGRLGATVRRRDPGAGQPPADPRLAAAGPREPATEQLLLGLVGGEGTGHPRCSPTPATDEARVEVRIVTEDASFVPGGPGGDPGRARSRSRPITLTETLRSQVRRGRARAPGHAPPRR